MSLVEFLTNKKDGVIRHYEELISAIKQFKNTLGNLAGVYFTKKNLKWPWIVFDSIILIGVTIGIIDISYFIIGTIFGPVGIGNTMLVSEQGYVPIDTNSIGRSSSIRYPMNCKQNPYSSYQYEDPYEINLKKDFNLTNKHSLLYSLDIYRVYYCNNDLSSTTDERGELKDIVVRGSLITCFNECNAYPFLISSKTSLIAPNGDFNLEITNLSFKYTKLGTYGNEYTEMSDIRLNYIITKRVNRPFWYFTEKYISVIPNILVPNIVNLVETIKSSAKIGFM